MAEEELLIEDGETIEVELPSAEAKEAPVVVTQDDGIAELKKQLEEAKQQAEVEKRAREAAELRAKSSDQQAIQFRSAAEQSQYETVVRALDQHQAQADIIEARLTKAMESGDYVAAAKAQREQSAMQARIIQLENGKLGLEQKRNQPAERTVDPIEAQLAQFSGPTRDWLRSHPDVLTNPEQGQLAASADIKAKRAGYQPDTTEYFAFVERELGYAQPMEPAKPRAAPIPAAPPSRETSPRQASSGGMGLTPDQARHAASIGIQVNGNTVRLNAKARANAETCGLSDADYAKAALADIRDGRISDRIN
jgi:hypothetical protein